METVRIESQTGESTELVFLFLNNFILWEVKNMG